MATDTTTNLKPFVHLHVHTQYSLLDGACRTKELVKRAKELNQPAVSITDHGCLFGVVDFYTKAKDAGIKPIIGIEAYMAPGEMAEARKQRTTTGVKDGGYHLLLLAADAAGYANILKLSSIAYREGFYYKPRIDKDVLKAHSAGIIATSACLGGEIPSAIMKDDRKRAKMLAETYASIFGPDRFFIEVQKHIPEQDQVNPELMDLADRMGIGIVATNDVHFLNAGDHAPHDVLCCISTGKLVSEDSRMKYSTQLYLKSSEEMYAAMSHPKWTEACENTSRIAEMCNVELPFGQNHAPVVKIGKKSPESRVQSPESKGNGKSTTRKTPDSGPRTLDSSPPIGSTDWYKDFCAQYELLPFDELNDKAITAADLKTACDTALRELTEAGAIWRYGENGITQEHRDRMERELKILADKNISAYFLIVWDFVNEARRRGIPANARGSGVGTMVGYCLGLSNACPIQYGLLFERFTDPDRSEYPDIDIDMCQDGRQEIIDYVRQKYGHVAQIITFGTLKARAAIRDVGRVLNLSLGDVDKVCKLVGDGLGTTITSALEQQPDLQRLHQENPQVRAVLDTAKRLEGLTRHAGVHAAGVIIATQPLDNIVPLYQPPGTDQIVTQWDGPTCEKIGLLKMDFLGLRTLSIIEKAKALIRATLSPEVIRKTVEEGLGFRVSGVGKDKKTEATPAPSNGSTLHPTPHTLHPSHSDPLDLDRLTFDDQKVLDLFRRGETSGVFQFESEGMRGLLMGMKPDRLEDLIAANALYRPGPMELIPDYNDRKHGRSKVPQLHPIVDQLTAETYGIMVYQEQVMLVVHKLGDIPLRSAYTLIKAIGKKQQDKIDSYREKFIEGAQKKGVTNAQAVDFFNLILKFAGYGFNKSHSTGYAIVAYQTAFLKTYFPVQYMAAVLTYESVSTDKVVEYINECRKVAYPDPKRARGIEVKQPDINLSSVGFTVVFDKGEVKDASHGHIRFGLSAVKGVGEKAILKIIEAREKDGPFRSLYNFCERVDQSALNRATVEALVKCGAFDSLHGIPKRAAMVAAIEDAMKRGAQEANLRQTGSLWGMVEDAPKAAADHADPALPNVAPWLPVESLANEKSVLGFFVSSHPMNEQRDTIARFSNVTIADIQKLSGGVEVCIGGMLTRIKTVVTKNGRSAGQKMAMIAIEDPTAHIEGVAFAETYATYAPLLTTDRIVFIKGKVDRKREAPNIIINQIIDASTAAKELTQAVRIVLKDPGTPGTPGTPNDPGTQGPDSTPRHGDLSPRDHADGSVFNGSLRKLKELLRQASGRGSAEVLLEVHQAGRVATLRVQGLRIATDNDLTARIETVLDSPGCCQLVGPNKLMRSPGVTTMMHDDSASRERLRLPADAGAPDEEFCPSIDRY